jgi:hypothetical protein
MCPHTTILLTLSLTTYRTCKQGLELQKIEAGGQASVGAEGGQGLQGGGVSRSGGGGGGVVSQKSGRKGGRGGMYIHTHTHTHTRMYIYDMRIYCAYIYIGMSAWLDGWMDGCIFVCECVCVYIYIIRRGERWGLRAGESRMIFFFNQERRALGTTS